MVIKWQGEKIFLVGEQWIVCNFCTKHIKGAAKSPPPPNIQWLQNNHANNTEKVLCHVMSCHILSNVICLVMSYIRSHVMSGYMSCHVICHFMSYIMSCHMS